MPIGLSPALRLPRAWRGAASSFYSIIQGKAVAHQPNAIQTVYGRKRSLMDAEYSEFNSRCPLVRNRRTRDVAARAFELLAFARLAGDAGTFGQERGFVWPSCQPYAWRRFCRQAAMGQSANSAIRALPTLLEVLQALYKNPRFERLNQ